MWQWPCAQEEVRKRMNSQVSPGTAMWGGESSPSFWETGSNAWCRTPAPFLPHHFCGKKKCWEPCPLIQVNAVKMWLADNSCYSFLGTAPCHTAVLIFCTTLLCVHPQCVSFENFRSRDLSKTRAPQHLTLTEQNLSLLYFPLICFMHLTQEV